MATWPNLVQFTTVPQAFWVWDFMNDKLFDADFVAAVREAFIRRIWTVNSECRQAIMVFFSVADKDEDDYTALNQADITALKTLAAYYGITLVDYQSAVEALVDAGGHLSTYFADQTHPSADGYQLAYELLAPELLSGGTALSGALPARLYAASADFEQTSTIKNGTDYDSKTGTWTETGTRIESTEEAATITFSGTFRSFGCYHADYPTMNAVDISVDGGAFAETYFSQNGYDIGTRAAHTLIIKVRAGGKCRIDKFWAI